MQKENILIVEDEDHILELISYNLSKDGYQVSGASSAEEALTALKRQTPDVILLDLMLPGMDGLEACRQIKADPKNKNTAIVMVTAKGEESDIVTGLELGADDYITKPFSPRVLVARIRAVLRRKARGAAAGPAANMPITREGLTIHPGRHEVRLEGRDIHLTSTEFRLLYYLASQPGWVFTRSQIVESIRGTDYHVTDRSVDVLVFGLRKKLGDLGHVIETIRGVGYRFKE